MMKKSKQLQSDGNDLIILDNSKGGILIVGTLFSIFLLYVSAKLMNHWGEEGKGVLGAIFSLPYWKAATVVVLFCYAIGVFGITLSKVNRLSIYKDRIEIYYKFIFWNRKLYFENVDGFVEYIKITKDVDTGELIDIDKKLEIVSGSDVKFTIERINYDRYDDVIANLRLKRIKIVEKVKEY